MGRRRFRLSDIMPKAWFYKLKDMNTITKLPPSKHPHPLPTPSKQPLTPNRASCYFPSNSPIHPKAFDTHFPLDSPRKSTRKPRKIASSSSISSSNRASISVSVSESESEKSYSKDKNFNLPSSDIVLELRPIITKPMIKRQSLARAKANSPRISTTRRVRAVAVKKKKKRGGIAESFAVVKSSSDPKRDFRESMMEMIVENGLSSPKDLEELLACYLSLNSSEYHDVIVKVFEEIWFDITRLGNK